MIDFIKSNAGWVALVILVILSALHVFQQSPTGIAVGATGTGPNCGGSVTCLSGDLYASASITGNTLVSLTTALVPGIFSQGGATLATGLQSQVTVTSCATATTTAFVVANPFTATSTAVIERFNIAGQATTTSFSVGTTTKSTGLALSDVSASFVSAASVATSSVSNDIIPGQTTALGTGQLSAGSGTVAKILVGPSESVAGFATSTATGAGAANYIGGNTCTVKIKWST